VQCSGVECSGVKCSAVLHVLGILDLDLDLGWAGLGWAGLGWDGRVFACFASI